MLDDRGGEAIREGMSTRDSDPSLSRREPEAALFPIPDVPEAAGPDGAGRPRLRRADRHQVVMRTVALDALLPEDHTARLVWEYVAGVDCQALYAPIRAVEGRAGRDAIDPRILLALWLYATLDGVGSARRLEGLCEDHAAYQWICGGVSVNYHTLSDFRTCRTEFLDALLTRSVAVLLHQDLVTMQRVAQDGMRVRASAGAASFRRRPTLEACRVEAQEQVETLRKDLASDPGGASARESAARERAARERSERIRRALDEMPDVESKKAPEAKAKARVSTTDPEARVMKMPDGGFRPAHNVQFASDTGSQVIVGVEVVNSGSDQGQMAPMVDQLQERYGKTPPEMLVDGGFAKKDDIDRLAPPNGGTTVYAPVCAPKKHKDRDRYEPHARESPAVAEWRGRMGTPEAKAIYKDRASTAECVNAISRNRGLRQFLVRGLAKVRAVALWFALAHNLMRAVALRVPAAAAMA